MIKKSFAIIALLLAATALTACASSTKTEQQNMQNNSQTSYLYLGDDGTQQWRTTDTDNNAQPSTEVNKNYASQFGRR